MSGRKAVKTSPAVEIDDDPSAVSVEFRDNFMYVYLEDGRYVSVPITAYRRLREATPAQRDQVEVTGMSLHWDEIDEDLSVSGLVRDFGAKDVKISRA
jgi:hypothetical protein